MTTPPERLWVVNQTFTKHDMVYSDFLWSPPDTFLVLILDLWKYGHNQIYLYIFMAMVILSALVQWFSVPYMQDIFLANN